MFLVTEQTGAVTFGNTQTHHIILSRDPDFPNKIPKLRSSTCYIM